MSEISCPFCIQSSDSSESRTKITRHGFFLRASDQSLQPRFRCHECKKTFSVATFHPCYRQKKREKNPDVFQYLVSGVSQRRLARTLQINRKTVVRKFLFIALAADHYFRLHREGQSPVQSMEFDDLETFEHTKMKPLSVTMAVESKTRRILGFRVSRMNAKGLLVQKALQKYGRRKDERKKNRESLFQELQPFLEENALIRSDENPHYASDVRRCFPNAQYQVFKGLRGCVTGQGELKSGGYDPLFSLNHTFAMFRANINRLFRRTWNTTKKPERLALHISLYCLYHNLVLIE